MESFFRANGERMEDPGQLLYLRDQMIGSGFWGRN